MSGSSGSQRSTQDDHLQFVGGMCRGAAPPLPLLARIQPVIDASVVLRETVGDSTATTSNTATLFRSAPFLEEGGPLFVGDGCAAGKPKDEVALQSVRKGDGGAAPRKPSPSGGGWERSAGKAEETERDARTEEGERGGEGGERKEEEEEKKQKPVLMYNPFAHKSRIITGLGGRGGGGAGGGVGEDDEPLTVAGQWVKGELRTVQVSVRNPLGVELVLDKAKVMTCGAHAEVYPVTVLVPPSATHQVTFEVSRTQCRGDGVSRGDAAKAFRCASAPPLLW